MATETYGFVIPFPRIIAKLEVKGDNVIKGIHLEGVRPVGNPEELAKKYYDQGADELCFLAITASSDTIRLKYQTDGIRAGFRPVR